jgi:hypothetical protein
MSEMHFWVVLGAERKIGEAWHAAARRSLVLFMVDNWLMVIASLSQLVRYIDYMQAIRTYGPDSQAGEKMTKVNVKKIYVYDQTRPTI